MKRYPKTMPCDAPGCDGTLVLVSIEEGYTCSNAFCPLHIMENKPDIVAHVSGRSMLVEAKPVTIESLERVKAFGRELVAEVLADNPDRYHEGDFMLGGDL